MQPYALTLDKFIDHAARWHGDAQVVTGGGGGARRIGYAGLRDEANRLSGALAALGLRVGDRIATLAWNTQDHLAIWYATAGLGVVCHTLNPRLTVAQLAAMVNQAEDRVIAYDAGLAGVAAGVAALCPTVGHMVELDGADDVVPGRAAVRWTLDGLLHAHGAPAAWGGFAEDEPAGLCFTSGTTGAPKGVVYTHRSNYLHTLRLLQADALALTDDDSVLAAVPMFHANGWGLPFAAPAVGARLVLPGRDASGAALADLIDAEGVTVAAGVPTVWLGLLDHLDAVGRALPTLRRIYLGGAPLPLAAQRRMEERLGVTVHASWGMTELSPLGTVSPHGSARTPAGSSGRVPIGLDLKLTDGDGRDLPAQRGVQGHLRVKGQSVVERYFGAAAPATDDQGWFDTGDLAVIGDDGSLSITGRAKDLIKSGGEWINPAEIEGVAGGVPGVALAAVIGRPDEKWGERPLLVIETVTSCDVEDAVLIEALRAQVARWWLPDAIVRIERMPLASTGKIDKMALRARYARPDEGGGPPTSGAG